MMIIRFIYTEFCLQNKKRKRKRKNNQNFQFKQKKLTFQGCDLEKPKNYLFITHIENPKPF